MSKFYRKKTFYIKFFTVCVSLSSLWGSIISFSPISLDKIEFQLSILIIIAISFIVGVVSIPKIVFPTEETIDFAFCSKRKSKIVFPCTYNQYKIANKIADESFEKKDSPCFRKVDAWRRRNPLILSLYYDANNKVKGYFDVLPLKAEFESKLREGTLTEQDINYDSMIPPEEMYNSEIIYIGGIAEKADKKGIRPSPIHAGLMLHALFLYIKTFYSFEKKTTISATAATSWGTYWLNELGFSIYKEGIFRNDGHDYYVKEVTFEDIKRLGKKFEKNIDHKIDCSAYNDFINSDYGKRIIKKI